MADGSALPTASVDTRALNDFVNYLHDQAGAIDGQATGIKDADGALEGTDWQAICMAVDDSVNKVVKRIGARYGEIADSVKQVSTQMQLTDQQFADDLSKIGLHA